MNRSGKLVSKVGPLKRKRRSSDDSLNIENNPCGSKRLKDDKFSYKDSESDERFPLTELSILQHADIESQPDVNDPESFITSSFSSPESAYDLSVESLNSSCDNDACVGKNFPVKNFKPNCGRKCPWPSVLYKLNWVNVDEWWSHYYNSDKVTSKLRDTSVFDRHPNLQPRMRAVLLEWLIEVCDVFKLHRETYYLTLDYLDRYLLSTRNIPKGTLQLIGVSCLLIASKVEEIYPPKVAEYAFVTDGACCENDILEMEIKIIQELNWKFKSITPNCWLLIYLQFGYLYIRKDKDLNSLKSLYPLNIYRACAQLLDLVTLDIQSLRYSYSMLAVSALHIVCREKFPLKVTGYRVADVKECAQWIEPFWSVMCEHQIGDCDISISMQPVPLPAKDNSQFLQQHVINMDVLEAAQSKVVRKFQQTVDILTPPRSSEKGALGMKK